MKTRKIEFEPGDVVQPEFDPENNLVALVVTEEGFESLHDEVCGDIPSGSSGEDGVPREAFRDLRQQVAALSFRVDLVEDAVMSPDGRKRLREFRKANESRSEQDPESGNESGEE